MAISNEQFKNILLALREVGEYEGVSHIINPKVDDFVKNLATKPFEPARKKSGGEEIKDTIISPKFDLPNNADKKITVSEDLKLHYTKSLSDYLTSTEQEFIRNNMDLINSENWVELRDKADNTFDYSESTTAIFKFLADGLGYDFTYFEELLKLE